MSVSKVRSFLYSAAKMLGDYNAIKRGRIGQRINNRIIGKLFSRILRFFIK